MTMNQINGGLALLNRRLAEGRERDGSSPSQRCHGGAVADVAMSCKHVLVGEAVSFIDR